MRVARRILQAGLSAFLLYIVTTAATAQNFPSNIPQGLLDQLNRQNSTTPYNPAQPLPSPLDQVRPQFPQQGLPGQPSPYLQQQLQELQAQRQRSKLELDYSRRAGTMLTQYGYDLFRTIVPSQGDLLNGAVPDNYRLNIGDELVITLQGQVQRSLRTRVDREGRVVIPDLPPIPAAGRSFGEFRNDLDKTVAGTFLNTRAFVSVGSVRQISVTVVGEAVNPGVFRMGGFATALDALALAGGVKKTGSLRHLILVRGAQQTRIDLYPVITGSGAQPDLSIGDGDRIIIPPIGPTAAVSGEVDRPGIYELPENGPITGAQLLALAGAPLRPEGNRFVKLSLDQSGRDLTTEANAIGQLSLRPGDILEVLLRSDLPVGSVRLDGAVRVPGIRSLASAPDVRRLIGSSDAFLGNPYLPFGAIETIDPQTRAKHLVPIDIEAIMQGRTNVRLKDGDTIIVLSIGDVNYIASADVQAVLSLSSPPILRQRIVTRNPRAPVPENQQQSGFRYGQNQGALETQQQILESGPVPGGETQPGEPQQQSLESLLVPDLSAISPQSNANEAAPNEIINPSLQSQGAQSRAITALQAARDFQAQQAQQICRGLQELAAVRADSRTGRFTNALLPPAVAAPTTTTVQASTVQAQRNIENEFPCPPIFDKYPDLLTLAVEYSMTVEGEVIIPGPYPVLAGTPLASVVTEAGGLTRSVDLQRVEVTHYGVNNVAGTSTTNRELLALAPSDLEKVAISPGDVVRFNAVFIDRDTGLVSLNGEFRRPGNYDIRHGERLSEVVQRAGGLTDEAYPYGTVFTRLSIKAQEREAYLRAAQQIESGLTTSLAHAQSTEQAQAIVASSQQIVNFIRNTEPVGRMVVEADPVVLAVKPQVDPIMQPGDTVFVPKRPSTVSVTGEVLNPTSLQFRPGATPADYIKAAGGFTQSAEDSEVFIVLPNGEAQPVKISYWNFTPIQVPPGSTIVVPKNLAPFDVTTFLKDSTQIFSQLAISAASLAVLHSNSTR